MHLLYESDLNKTGTNLRDYDCKFPDVNLSALTECWIRDTWFNELTLSYRCLFRL